MSTYLISVTENMENVFTRVDTIVGLEEGRAEV